MSRKGCGCSECTAPNKYKDFRQSKGDGPEEMPHRKKKNLKAKGKVYDHRHIIETDGWEKQYHSMWNRERGCYVRNPDRWYFIRKWICLECGEVKKTEYEWKRDPVTGHYYR